MKTLGWAIKKMGLFRGLRLCIQDSVGIRSKISESFGFYKKTQPTLGLVLFW